MKNYHNYLSIVVITAINLLNPYPILAQRDSVATKPNTDTKIVDIEELENVPVKNDFSLGPTRLSYSINPGDKVEAVLQITSRIEGDTKFVVGIEDFISSEDPSKYTIFLGEEKSQFSSKEWFKPELSEFTLKHGQRLHLPITIQVPKDAEPGDHYSAVFVQTSTKHNNESGISLSSRVGALFLLRIEGKAKTEGNLISFTSDKPFYLEGPIKFALNFQNNGNVHLTPFGKIEIANVLGKTVAQIEVHDWVVLRDSQRAQIASWAPSRLSLGRYTAKVQIQRGYDNLIDTKEIAFYVIPGKLLGSAAIAVGLLLLLFKFITSKYEFKLHKKQS